MEDSGKRRGRWEWRKTRHVQSLIFSSIESLGQFCVIFHFSVSFSCQLWQQLLSTILPTSPVAFLLPASTQRPSPQSSHLFSSYRIPQSFTWTRFCSGEISQKWFLASKQWKIQRGPEIPFSARMTYATVNREWKARHKLQSTHLTLCIWWL